MSSFHQITARKDTVRFPLTPCGTPTGPYLLAVPWGSSDVSPGWFANVIGEVSKGLVKVAAYPDSVITFESDLSAHMKVIRAFFERLQQYNLKQFDFTRRCTPERRKSAGCESHANAPGPDAASLYFGRPVCNNTNCAR